MVQVPGYSLRMLGRDPAKVASACLAKEAPHSKIDYGSVKSKDHRAVVGADAAHPARALGLFRAKKARLKCFQGY